MAQFIDNGSFTIKGFKLFWKIRHWGGASNAYENHRGIAVCVNAESGKERELIVEFPFNMYFFEKPRSQRDFEAKLFQEVELALDQGWDPKSRGKAKTW
ncbi:MAG TPA: hypothetical protein VLB82_02925 [Thermodesulfobacteriota bacterium]|nr:hypothetical protein [Thermodesulfobacteriota bacterium]